MLDYLKIFLIGLVSPAITIILYLLNRKTKFGNINYWVKQIIIGSIFGVIAILGTELGVPFEGAMINARDAAPLCAGLIFGAPAGIIAGVIGGVERFLSPLWGVGAYTRWACSISTLLAGFFAAALKKTLYKGQTPRWYYALATAIIMEVFHMLMIFVTNMNDVEKAFTLVKSCTNVMVFVNAFAVTIAALFINIYERKEYKELYPYKPLQRSVAGWLLLGILAGFMVSSTFTYILETNSSDANTRNILSININDVKTDIEEASDENLLELTRKAVAELETVEDITCEYLTAMKARSEYDVSVISYIDSDGLIEASSDFEFLGFDMNSGEQSREFLVLNNGVITEYVQKYRRQTIDGVYMKYAGIVLSRGGFIQVGYNQERFERDIYEEIKNVARNRHVGSKGYIIIASEDGKIVSSNNNSSSLLSLAGIDIEFSDDNENSMFTANVYDNKSYCMYTITEGYVILAVEPYSEVLFSRDLTIYITVFLQVLVFAIMYYLIFFLLKKLVLDNIHKVTHSLYLITEGNLDTTVDVRTNQEFVYLSDDINKTVGALKGYITEAEERIDKELEFAREIQTSQMPKVFPPYPNIKEFDIYAGMRTAKEVGGDFYDFYFVGENRFAILIADVSGKGIPAAMFMMNAKSVIKSLAETGKSPDEILNKANMKLCENNDAEMFVTCFLGIINLTTGVIEYANAGHNPPVIVHKDGTCSYLKGKRGLVLAGMDDFIYKADKVTLDKGDSIFLYTDGVTEAENMNDELYGEDRLESLLSKCASDTPEQLCEAVINDVDDFSGEREQFDDITMLSFKYNGSEGKSMLNDLSNALLIDATKESIDVATSFVNSMLDSAGCPDNIKGQIDVAIDEIVQNIVSHAYDKKGGKVAITAEIGQDGKSIILKFIDSGNKFDPLSLKDPDTTLSAEERGIGGLGIYMVKKTMDEVTYEYISERNTLTIVKSW